MTRLSHHISVFYSALLLLLPILVFSCNSDGIDDQRADNAGLELNSAAAGTDDASASDGSESDTSSSSSKTFTVTGKLTNVPIRMIWLMDHDRHLRKHEELVTEELNDLVSTVETKFPSADLKIILVSFLHHDRKDIKVTKLSQQITLNGRAISRGQMLHVVAQLTDNSNNNSPYGSYFADKDSIKVIVGITSVQYQYYNHGTRNFLTLLKQKFDDISSFRFYGFIDKEFDLRHSRSSHEINSYSDLAKELQGQVFDVLRYNNAPRPSDTARNERSELDAAFATLKKNILNLVEPPETEFPIGDASDIKKVTVNGKSLYPDDDYQFNGSSVKILASVSIAKGDTVTISFEQK